MPALGHLGGDGIIDQNTRTVAARSRNHPRRASERCSPHGPTRPGREIPDAAKALAAGESAAATSLLHPLPQCLDNNGSRTFLPPHSEDESRTFGIASLEVSAEFLEMARGLRGAFRETRPSLRFIIAETGPNDLGHGQNGRRGFAGNARLVDPRPEKFGSDPRPDQRLPLGPPRPCGGEGKNQTANTGQQGRRDRNERADNVAVKARDPNTAAEQPQGCDPDENLQRAPRDIDNTPRDPESDEKSDDRLCTRVDHRRTPALPTGQERCPEQRQRRGDGQQRADQRGFEVQGKRTFHLRSLRR